MQVGDIVDDKYELIRLIGEGGMGAVYEGRNVRIGRRVALKFLRHELIKQGELVIRFQREARAAAEIGSEYIANVYDAAETEDGVPFIVMEYLEGEDLLAVLKREGTLSVDRACWLITQACRGLAAAHRRGIIHRDIKPENLFLTLREDGAERVKIFDFGIAKFRNSMAEANPRLTATGITLGTPYYMSPEQIDGALEVDHRTDIYSLGVILYELLTGRPPFMAQSFNQLIIMVATATPRPPREHNPEIPAKLEQAILTAMAREREDRYESMVELSQALAPFCGNLCAAPHLDGEAADEEGDREDVERADDRAEGTTESFPEHDSSWDGDDAGEPSDRRATRVVVAGVCVCLVMAVIIAVIAAEFRGSRQTTDASTNDRPSLVLKTAERIPAAEASRANGETFRIEVSVEPPNARLRIDGANVDRGEDERAPFVGTFRRRRDGTPLRIEAFAEGFEPYSELVSLDEDRSITIELQPIDVDMVPIAEDLSGQRPRLRPTTIDRREEPAEARQPTPPPAEDEDTEASAEKAGPTPVKRGRGIVPSTKRRLERENPYGSGQ